MPPLTPEQARELDRFPAPLRQLIDSELAAGNGIAHLGGGFPAPPAGAMLMLTHPLRSGAELLRGLAVRARDSTVNHLEIGDAEGCFWILTPPLPPPGPIAMDRIRELRNSPSVRPPPAPATEPAESLEVDIRGETLVYRAAGRTACLAWTYTRGHHVYRSSLTEWTGPGRGERQPMTPAEQERVIARILALAAGQGITGVRVCD